MQYKKRHDQSLERARAEQLEQEKIDSVTGRELFKPHILSTPHAARDRDRDIWEELYSYKKPVIMQSPPSVRIIDKNSEKITEKIRYRKYEEIFKSLQPDNGKIKYNSIDYMAIDHQIVEIINPLIQELAESEQALDFKQFCEAMDALLKVLTPQEKWYIMFVNKNKSDSRTTQASNTPTDRSRRRESGSQKK